MKSFLDLAKKRKTTYEFSKQQVPEAALKKILEAGRWSPSFRNLQPWYFIVVKRPETIREIVRTAYYGVFHTSPPILVVIALSKEASGEKRHRGVLKGEIGHDEAMMSIAMPALMMALEAEELGVDSCKLSLDERKLPASLNLRGRRAPIALGLGYPEIGTTSAGMMHQRKPLSEIVKKERL